MKEQKDKLPGGIGDGAKEGSFNSEQLARGTKVEMEHTDDKEIAKEIAMDHLTEDPQYYDKLEKVHIDEEEIEEVSCASQGSIEGSVDTKKNKKQNSLIREEEIVPIEIDLGMARKGKIDESFLTAFGSAIEMVLGRMFGGNSVPINVRGTRREIDSFANVLSKEKKYMKAYKEAGLSDASTMSSKYKLQKAIEKFEKNTGIIYPLK